MDLPLNADRSGGYYVGKSHSDNPLFTGEMKDLFWWTAERSEAEKELKTKMKEWKKKESALNKATNILKQMEKTAAA